MGAVFVLELNHIVQRQLSETVSTTWPRISVFMPRFRNLGLIETNSDHFLIIKENKLTDYPWQNA